MFFVLECNILKYFLRKRLELIVDKFCNFDLVVLFLKVMFCKYRFCLVFTVVIIIFDVILVIELNNCIRVCKVLVLFLLD